MRAAVDGDMPADTFEGGLTTFWRKIRAVSHQLSAVGTTGFPDS